MARGDQAKTADAVTEAVDVAPHDTLEEAARLERADEPKGGTAVHTEPYSQLAHTAHLCAVLERLEDLQCPIHCLHRVAHDATKR